MLNVSVLYGTWLNHCGSHIHIDMSYDRSGNRYNRNACGSHNWHIS